MPAALELGNTGVVNNIGDCRRRRSTLRSVLKILGETEEQSGPKSLAIGGLCERMALRMSMSAPMGEDSQFRAVSLDLIPGDVHSGERSSPLDSRSWPVSIATGWGAESAIKNADLSSVVCVELVPASIIRGWRKKVAVGWNLKQFMNFPRLAM